MMAKLHPFDGLLALCLLLGCQTSVWAEHKPLSKEEQAKVDQAIERGVKFLKSQQYRKGPHAGTWNPHPLNTKYNKLGYTLLPVLTLLECGVPADDPGIQQAVRLLRQAGPKIYETYDLALAILVLDRLKDPQDKNLLTSLGLRLVAGQCRSGGWCYVCPRLSPEDEKGLLTLLQNLEQNKGGRGAEATERPRRQDVPKRLRVLTLCQDLAALPQADPDPDTAPGSVRTLYVGATDNSSTQFAMLGLWRVRRYGIPVMPSFRLALERFQSSQAGNGTWGYRYLLMSGRRAPGSRAMTTVGLLAFACAEGLKEKDEDPGVHFRILYGFAALSREIDLPTGQMRRRLLQPDLYFLWSVERVARLYNLELIGNKDWYRWGAEILVTNQTRRGDWAEGMSVHRPGTGEVIDYHSTYSPNINTCFALLFLKRSNLTKDLTAKLPYKPEELNKGIIQAVENPQAIPRIQKIPRSRSQHPGSR